MGSGAAFLLLSVSSPLIARSEGYPLYPAQVPSGKSQLAREASNPLQRPGVGAVVGGGGELVLAAEAGTRLHLV